MPFKRPASIAQDKTKKQRNDASCIRVYGKTARHKIRHRYGFATYMRHSDDRHIDLAIKKLSESSLKTLASVKGPFTKRQPIIKINCGVLEPYAPNLPDADMGFWFLTTRQSMPLIVIISVIPNHIFQSFKSLCDG